METAPPKPGSMAPPPAGAGPGGRGFDKLQNPGGIALVAFSIIAFAWLCYFGSRWVRAVSAGDAESRRQLRESVEAARREAP